MTVQAADIARALPKARKSANGWTACCPAHDDRNPSLFIADGSDGVALRCHAGCSYSDISQALQLRGLDVRGSYSEGIPASHFQLGAYHAHWDYRDAHGRIVHRVCRWDLANGRKEIRPLSLTPEGWKWQHHATPRPLYNLDSLAREPDRPVYVVEGEKAATAAQTLFPAVAVTTWPGGAQSVGKVDWSPLKGRTVTLIPDCDGAGVQAMQRVSEALARIANAVRTIDPRSHDATLSEGWDLADALAEGRDVSAWFASDAPQVSAVNVPHGEAWGDPEALPEGLPQVQAWEFDLLPASLRAYVRDSAERLSVAPELVAVPLIGVLGSAIGRSRVLEARSGWVVVPNLWTMTIAPPSSLKSPARDASTCFLDELEREAAAQFSSSVLDQKAREVERNERRKKSRKAVSAALDDGDDAAAAKAAREMVELDDESVTPERLIAQNFTIEKIGELLRDNPRGITLSLDELAGLFRQCERQGHEPDRAFLLTASEGTRPVTWDTIGRGTTSVPHACVSVGGTIQPARIAELVRGAEGSDADGLIQRFGLAVFPDSVPYAPSLRAVDEGAKGAVRAIIWKLRQPHPVDSGGEPTLYRFAATAQIRFDAWDIALRNRIREVEQEAPALGQYLGKLSRNVAALALIFHLVTNEGQGEEVETDSLELAFRWAGLLESHAARIYAPSTQRHMDAARRLLKYMRDGRLPRTFAARDVYRHGWSLLASPESVADALRVLVDFDYVRPREIVTAGRTGQAFEMHPALPAKENSMPV